MDESQINVMFDANQFLNDKSKVDFNLNNLIQGLNSISEYERLLNEINKIIESNFIQTIVYNNLQVSIFKRLKEHLSFDDENINFESEWNDKSMAILKLTIQLLAEICEKTPSNIEKLDHLIDRIELILDVLKDENLSEEFNKTIFDAKSGYLERQKQTNQKKDHNKSDLNVQPPEDFRTISVIPTLDEIKSSKRLFLRANLKYGSFHSVEHYLDVQFRLLREDYVGSLREGVMEYLEVQTINSQKKNKHKPSSNMNIRVYDNVKILKYLNDDDSGIYHLIQLEMTPKLKKVRWETSKRLIQGSLVCFTNNNFKTAYFAVIFDRDLKKLSDAGQLLVKFEDWITVNDNFLRRDSISSSFTMVETLAYFESYRYTLESLKLFNEKNFPFSKYIVYSQNSELNPPKYLENRVVRYDFEPLIKEPKYQNYTNIEIRQLKLWPSSSLLGLNDSQYKALQLALTSELVVIQGPPGTGKTFVGVEIIKMLLHNYDQIQSNRIISGTRRLGYHSVENPILIVCYTNHALDQLLVLISKFIGLNEIVRIGGRSKENILDECNLQNLKKNAIRVKFREKRDQLSFTIRYINILFDELNNHNVLNYERLREFSEESLWDGLFGPNLEEKHKNEVFMNWLGFGDTEYKSDPKKFVVNKTNVKEDIEYHGSLNDNALEKSRVSRRRKIQLENLDKYTEMSEDEVVKLSNLWNLNFIDRVKFYKYLCKNYYTELSERSFHMREECQEIEILMKKYKNPLQFNYHKLNKFCQESLWDGLFGSNLGENDKNIVFMNWLGFGDVEYDFDRSTFIDIVFDETENNQQNISDQNNNSNNYNQEEAELLNQQRELDDDFEKQGLIWKLANEAVEGTRNEDLEWRKTKTSKRSLKEPKPDQINLRRKSQLENLKKYGKMREDEVAEVTELWNLSLIDRIKFYKYLCDKYYNDLKETLDHFKQEYKENEIEFLACKEEESYQLLKSKKVIGMTTTGAAKHHSLLKLIKPKIVIAEEAAEVFESHIITCITESCEQLILIGDNEQLCPTPNLYKLSKRYNLNVSLFERLVNNNIPRVRLNVQHRMRPEISFFMQHFYDDLIDNDSVKNFENIKGLTKNVFFINHSSKEEGDEESLSKSNIYEAKYLTRLCDYLLKQNYEPEKITILVAYGGQLLAMKNAFIDFSKSTAIPAHPDLQKVRITPIDNYQGEENDIILLSLVRSNNYNSIGFLAVSNRVCVAMSRARKGFYLIANFKHLAQNSKLWTEIVSNAEKQQIIGETLTLVCQNHPNKQLMIKKIEDFQLCINGGCQEICKERLIECGHTCDQTCHVMDHKYLKCLKPCERIFKNCSLDHKCDGICFEGCRNCPIFVTKVLPKCGHSKNMRCSDDPNNIKCRENVSTELECHHLKDFFCFKNQVYQKCFQFYGSCRDLIKNKSLNDEFLEGLSVKEFNCQEIIHKAFKECEHTLNIECYKKDSIICEVRVSKVLKCGHSVLTSCSTDSNTFKCLELASTELNCGHLKDVVCYKKQEYESAKDSKISMLKQINSKGNDEAFKCETLVDKSFKTCSHTIRVKCCEQNLIKFQVCNQIVSKELKCGHSVEINCNLDPNQSNCMQFIDLKLVCGHIKKIKCHEEQQYQNLKTLGGKSFDILLKSDQLICKEVVEKIFDGCNHMIKIKCSEKNLNEFQVCNAFVTKKRICDHVFKTFCHMNPNQSKCMQLVDLKLDCRHTKKVKCHEEQQYQILKNSSEKDILLESDQFICKEIIEKHFQPCNHISKVYCFQNVCDKVVKKYIEGCSHYVDIPCNQDISKVLCTHYSHNERRQYKYYEGNKACATENLSYRPKSINHSNKRFNHNNYKPGNKNNSLKNYFDSKNENENEASYKRETRNHKPMGSNIRSGFLFKSRNKPKGLLDEVFGSRIKPANQNFFVKEDSSD